jgi:hypothetical protein
MVDIMNVGKNRKSIKFEPLDEECRRMYGPQLVAIVDSMIEKV